MVTMRIEIDKPLTIPLKGGGGNCLTLICASNCTSVVSLPSAPVASQLAIGSKSVAFARMIVIFDQVVDAARPNGTS